MWVDGRMGGWMDGWVGGWVDGDYIPHQIPKAHQSLEDT